MKNGKAGAQDFRRIYNLQDDQSRGRLIALQDSLLTGVCNVFVTGIFYTGFLSMYGISMTGTGIVTFIPYLANCFSIFSADVLGKISHRKAALLASKVIFYVLYILATTLMPRFVLEPKARMAWLCGLIFVAHAFYALFSPGFTAWYYHFFPSDNEDRTKYFLYNQMATSVVSQLALLGASLLADKLAASPYQGEVLLMMRYIAFAMMLVDVAIQGLAKEYDENGEERVRLREVFTLPLGHRKFMWCMGLMFFWSLNSNLSNGLWSYHLLNDMHFSYTLINVMSAVQVVIFFLTARRWRRRLDRKSWIHTFGFANLLWVGTEFAFFCMTPDRGWMYVPLMLIQQMLNVGLNLSYANVLYMNLPLEKTTSYVAFQAIGCNVFSFLGLLIGTWICSLNGGQTIPMLGMEVYPLLFTCILRGVNMLTIGLVCTKCWKVFSSEAEIERMAQWQGGKGT